MSEEELQTPRAARSYKRSNQRNPDNMTSNEQEEMSEEQEMQITQDQNLTTGLIVAHITEQKLTPHAL